MLRALQIQRVFYDDNYVSPECAIDNLFTFVGMIGIGLLLACAPNIAQIAGARLFDLIPLKTHSIRARVDKGGDLCRIKSVEQGRDYRPSLFCKPSDQ